MTAELYACLYAREFPAQALLRLRPDLRAKAVAVIEGDPPLQTVCSLNATARRMGAARGMTTVELETFPALAVLLRSTAEESSAGAALLECAGAFSPRVERCTEPYAFACVIDIAGTERLLGSPETVAHSLLERARALGIVASVAVSRNFYTAVCLARCTPATTARLIASRQESAALAPLPISILTMPEGHAEVFALWGIRTLGMLAALPETQLIARLGQGGRELRLLACGEAPHLFVPIEPEFKLIERMEFDAPVESLDSLLFVLNVMLQQLTARASARALALVSVGVTLSLDNRSLHERTVRPALPSNDRQVWTKLLHLDLVAHPPEAAILALSLSAEPGRTSKVQLGLFSPQLPEPTRLDVTLARIRAVVGEQCIGTPVLCDSHRQDAFRVGPFTVASDAKVNGATRTLSARRQLRPAESVYVTFLNQRPTAFDFRAKRYTVERVYGPWASSGEWWSPALWQSEEWDVIARSEDGHLLSGCLAHDPNQPAYQMVALYD